VTNATIAIVAAQLEQLPEVQRLARAVWHAHYPGIITSAQIDYMLERGYALPVLERFIATHDRGLYIALFDGVPSGFAAWYLTDNPAEAKLDKLYVLPSCQRLGLGGQLIAHVADRARAAKATTLILNVNRHNRQAIRAYEKRGFAIRTEVVVDIGNGYVMDDYVMYRTLVAGNASG
jgi:ribosomal protein S18 acetylase RimI-like enzyme